MKFLILLLLISCTDNISKKETSSTPVETTETIAEEVITNIKPINYPYICTNELFLVHNNFSADYTDDTEYKALYYDPKEHQYYMATGKHIDLSTNSNLINLHSLYTNGIADSTYLSTNGLVFEPYFGLYAGAISNLYVYTNERDDLSHPIFVKTLTPESFGFNHKNIPIPVLLTNEYCGFTEYVYTNKHNAYLMDSGFTNFKRIEPNSVLMNGIPNADHFNSNSDVDDSN